MCGEDYFYRDWPSPPPSGDGEPVEFEDASILDDLFDGDDDLPEFGDPEEDGDDWDDSGWFADDEDWVDELEDTFLTLEDAIMEMDEEALLEWLALDEEWHPRTSHIRGLKIGCIDWDEAA